jgi:hypothetical protein
MNKQFEDDMHGFLHMEVSMPLWDRMYTQLDVDLFEQLEHRQRNTLKEQILYHLYGHIDHRMKNERISSQAITVQALLHA